MKHQSSFILFILTGLFLLGLCSCATSTKFDTNLHVHYTDEKELMKTKNIEVPPHTKECFNGLKLGVLVNVVDKTDFERTGVRHSAKRKSSIDQADFTEAAREFTLNYLTRLKRYAVYLGEVQEKIASFQLVSEAGELEGDIYVQADLDFYLKLDVTLLKEIYEGYHSDREIYKIQLSYHLYNAKTGKAVLAGTCKNLTTRKGASYSFSGARIGGGNVANVRNAYRNVLENCMIEMKNQLAEKLHLAGNIQAGNWGDQITLLLDKGAEQGISEHQQFAVYAVQNDVTVPLGYAVASGTAAPDECNLILWQRAKTPEAKQIFKLWKKDLNGWVGDNEIYAVSIGEPAPPPSERANIKDWDTTKFEQKLMREWK